MSQYPTCGGCAKAERIGKAGWNDLTCCHTECNFTFSTVHLDTPACAFIVPLPEDTMDIYAIEGHKVKAWPFNNGRPRNGYDSDIEHAANYIKEGLAYTVKRTRVRQSSTSVEFVGLPGISFNSVHFYDVAPQTQEQRESHHAWRQFNRNIHPLHPDNFTK